MGDRLLDVVLFVSDRLRVAFLALTCLVALRLIGAAAAPPPPIATAAIPPQGVGASIAQLR